VRIALDQLKAYGHPNIKATHRSTLEFTKDSYITEKGDCIVGINATKSPRDLNEDLRIILRGRSIVMVLMRIGDLFDWIVGFGDPRLTLNDESRMIIRKSTYIDDSTLMIRANKAAADLDRNLVDRLKRGEAMDIHILGVSLE